MLFYVLNYIFLLNLAFKTPESAFERLTFIQYYLCQSKHLLGDKGDKLLSGDTTVKVQIIQPFSFKPNPQNRLWRFMLRIFS